MVLLRGRVQRMEALIDGILQYSRAGRVGTDAERVDVAALLREIVELLAPPADVTIVLGRDFPVLDTERVPLQQVFLNLIANAIKYTQRAGAIIRVDATMTDGTWTFSVADNGPGIAPEYPGADLRHLPDTGAAGQSRGHGHRAVGGQEDRGVAWGAGDSGVGGRTAARPSALRGPSGQSRRAEMAEHLLNILLVEDDDVDVMNVRRAFQRAHVSNPLHVAGNGSRRSTCCAATRYHPTGGWCCSTSTCRA